MAAGDRLLSIGQFARAGGLTAEPRPSDQRKGMGTFAREGTAVGRSRDRAATRGRALQPGLGPARARSAERGRRSRDDSRCARVDLSLDENRSAGQPRPRRMAVLPRLRGPRPPRAGPLPCPEGPGDLRARGHRRFRPGLAYEALARACALAGDVAEARRWAELAGAECERVAEDDDREIVLSDLETLPASTSIISRVRGPWTP